MAASSLYSLLCATLSLSDDPTYTRFCPPYVTDQPKYAGVPQQQRSALHLRAQRNFPEPSSGTFADVPKYYWFRGPPCALRPTSPAHLRTAPRTCAQPPCAPALRSFPYWRSASRKRSLHAPPCVVALNPLRPTSLRTCA
ncbi:hypothetical protein C8J57DRAFT_1515813 [Mycena rebaudengoi]|nr:hypothetical protein C8J57DRAFT_1515813 [Mycena rebaudengoi]